MVYAEERQRTQQANLTRAVQMLILLFSHGRLYRPE
jgi:hypothetical protein